MLLRMKPQRVLSVEDEPVAAQDSQRHRAMSQTARDGFWLANASGHLLEVNETYCRMSGYSAPELLSMRIADLEAAETEGTTIEHIKRIIARGEDRFESLHRRKDGTIFDVEVTVQYRPVEGGRFVAFLRDITARKRLEHFQALSAEVLGILSGADALPLVVQRILAAIRRETGLDAVGIRLRAGGDFPYFGTSGFSQTYVQAENQLAVRTSEGAFCLDERGNVRLECTCGLVLSGQTDPSMALFTPGGSAWTNDARSLLEVPAAQDPRLNPRNRCIHEGFQSVALIPIHVSQEIVGLLQLNDRRQSCFTLEMIQFFEGIAASFGVALLRQREEQSLRDAALYARNLIETSLDPLVTISAGGKITDLNRATEKITGVSRDGLIGSDFADYFTEPEKAQAGYLKAFAQGQVMDYPLAIRHSSGTTTEVLYNASVYRDDHGAVVGVFAAARDMTERKRAEAERMEWERRSQRLQKAESLNRMAGAIAHRFNNQLHAVMLNLGFAISELPNPPESLADALLAARKAAEVSAQMLTYLGQTRHKNALLDLTEACQQSLSMLRASLPGHVVFEADLPSPGPVIRSSSDQIQQVLTNLVTNAWEGTDGARGSIRLSLRSVAATEIPASNRFPLDSAPQDQAHACLEVADTGAGIRPEDIEKLFDPFFSSKSTGRGLGLSVVLGIVRAHHGVITVESQPGQGSRFRVFLPVSPEAVPQKPAPVPQDPPTAVSKTVLVVEDEPAVRKGVALVLKRLGYGVLTASDGVEALELFQQHRQVIGCVLSDLTMPRMNGWETLTALRGLAPDLPVILASGYSQAQVMEGQHPELPQAFLSKPYDLETLRLTINQVLASGKG